MVRIEHIWDKELRRKVTIKHSASAAREHALMSMFDVHEIISPLALRENAIVMPHYMERSADGIAGYCSEHTVWKFIYDVASGIAHIHNEGYIHHDIKPSNILITDTGFAIGDFGGCFKPNGDEINWEEDDTSHAFSAPEWSIDRKGIVPESDIWSLGASVFQMIMGVHIFSGRGGKVQKPDTQLPSLPKDRYSKELSSLICSCLAFNPMDRPSAEEVRQVALQKLKTDARPKRKVKSTCYPEKENRTAEYWPEEMEA